VVAKSLTEKDSTFVRPESSRWPYRLSALFAAAIVGLGGASVGPGARQALEWTRAAPMPVPRSEGAAATVGRELVVVGGFLADGRRSRRVDAYSPARNRWRRLPDLPVAVNHAMAASDGRRLYVVGGYGAPTRAFLLSRGRWRRLPNLPEPRAAAGAAIVGRTLYVVGGVARGGLAQRALAFDRIRRRWTRIPGPKPREHLGVSALGGRIYAVAGRDAGTNFDAFQAYVPGRRSWVSLPRVPETRGGTDSASVGPLLVSAGSESTAGTSAAVYAFDTRSRRWRRLPDLPTPRHGLGVLGFGGRVYVIGGGPMPGLSVSSANEFLRLR
jgi:N-acetylneuraminic acid mutarotase